MSPTDYRDELRTESPSSVNMINSPPVLVTGMHQCGTSQIGRVLISLGLKSEPEDQLIETRKLQQDEYPELRNIAELNEKLLEELGSCWLSPPTSSTDVTSLSASRLRNIALTTIDRQFRDGTPWFIEDPCISLLLPFWKKILPTKPVVLAIVRSPIAIAQNLQRQNNLPIDFTKRLTHSYWNALTAGCEGLASIVINYERAQNQPDETIELLMKFLTNQNIAPLSVHKNTRKILIPSHNHLPSVNRESDFTKTGLHGHSVPKQTKLPGLNPSELKLARVLEKNIKSITKLRIERNIAIVERNRTSSETKIIRLIQAAHMASNTYKLATIISKTTDRIAPVKSLRKKILSRILRASLYGYKKVQTIRLNSSTSTLFKSSFFRILKTKSPSTSSLKANLLRDFIYFLPIKVARTFSKKAQNTDSVNYPNPVSFESTEIPMYLSLFLYTAKR